MVEEAGETNVSGLPSQGLPQEVAASQDSHREGNGTPLQYSCLENPMDGGGW